MVVWPLASGLWPLASGLWPLAFGLWRLRRSHEYNKDNRTTVQLTRRYIPGYGAWGEGLEPGN
jgi:hypothetical protein